jgi:hypothetical protein
VSWEAVIRFDAPNGLALPVLAIAGNVDEPIWNAESPVNIAARRT